MWQLQRIKNMPTRAGRYFTCICEVSGSNLVWMVGFEVLTAVSTKMAVFWVVAPCSLVEVYQRFRGPCCLHHQGHVGKLLPDYTALQPRRQPSCLNGWQSWLSFTCFLSVWSVECGDLFPFPLTSGSQTVVVYGSLHANREFPGRRWNFRFSRQRVWRWLSSGLLRRVVWLKFFRRLIGACCPFVALMVEAASTS
jgi:hypothetical protein